MIWNRNRETKTVEAPGNHASEKNIIKLSKRKDDFENTTLHITITNFSIIVCNIA